MISVPDTEQYLDQIISDLDKMPLIVLGSRGSGKSESLKLLLKRALESREIVLKIFDSSGSWFWKAPVEYRQSVTLEDIKADRIQNIGSCVYDIFPLNRETRLQFLASIIALDFQERYSFMKTYGYDTVKSLPLLLYVLEECDTYLSTGVLRSKQISSTVISDLVSIGRNYKMNLTGITTRGNEIDTKLRERSNLLIARQTGRNSLNAIRGSTDISTKKLSQKLPDYHFIYWSGKATEPFRIRDTDHDTPKDYPLKVEIINHKPTSTQTDHEETDLLEWTYKPIRSTGEKLRGIIKKIIIAVILYSAYTTIF